jgi:hypothetical protein
MIVKQTSQRMLEIILVLISVVLTCVLHETVGYKIIVLNLFYLPVVLAAFYLGRYRAGVLAFFSVIAASTVTALGLDDFTASMSPLVVALSLLIWGAVLGLTALLVGTLSDELSSRMTELHEAYVGVVEVLSRYLQSAHPRLRDRSQRIADLCQDVAVQIRLSPKEVDDIRVAALLHDIENIEITARVIRKAIGEMEDEQRDPTPQHTFHGTELVHSLAPVLFGAFPLVLNQSEPDHQQAGLDHTVLGNVPFGAKIIHIVRAYDALMHGKWVLPDASPASIVEELRRDTDAKHDPTVLDALARVVGQAKYGQKKRMLVAAASGAEMIEV